MKQFIIMLLVSVCPYIAKSQSASSILYGKTDITVLRKEPYKTWFDSIYHAYNPNAKVVEQIKKVTAKDMQMEIYFGTWCGDSRREVPRMMKLLDICGIKPAQVSLIALGGSDSLYKQSPGGEEAGKGVFRVPAFIVSINGKEVGRINEYPAISLENDLLAITSGKGYIPNYKSFALVNKWLNDGILLDNNSSVRGLAMQLKGLVSGENDLNSLGYLLLKQQKKAEALRIFQLNAQLYPESANIISSLGEGYLENNDSKTAVWFLEKALELNKDPRLLKEILIALYKAKGFVN